eukprot:c29352_g1_i1 orf=1-1104(-)
MERLLTCHASIKQKLHMLNTVILPFIEYTYVSSPYSLAQLQNLERKLISLAKRMCHLPISTPNVVIQSPQHSYGAGIEGLLVGYSRTLATELHDNLNDQGRLGRTSRGLLHALIDNIGPLSNPFKLTLPTMHSFPMARTIGILHNLGIHVNSPQLESETSLLLWHIWDKFAISPYNEPNNIRKRETLKPLWNIGINSIIDILNYHKNHLLSINEIYLKFKSRSRQVSDSMNTLYEIICLPAHFCSIDCNKGCPHQSNGRKILPTIQDYILINYPTLHKNHGSSTDTSNYRDSLPSTTSSIITCHTQTPSHRSRKHDSIQKILAISHNFTSNSDNVRIYNPIFTCIWEKSSITTHEPWRVLFESCTHQV